MFPFQANADQELMIGQVLNDPRKYNDQVISIIGYISIEFENNTIAASKRYKYGDCVWIEFDKGPYETDEDMARYDKRKAIVKNPPLERGALV